MPALDLSTLTIDSSSPCPRIATAVHLIATRRHLIVGCHCHRREFRHKGRRILCLMKCLVPFVVSVRVVNVVIGYHLPWVVLGSVVLVRNQAQ
ncbi:hypothetical protein ZIOFF_067325 [Zingiber officinale]|uniref:Uncharacterized protein n=1 Tax=Zingiber officinale TaxID=94328 RepID=A0A8J5CDN6_ZINOF|nr:hypothetical protein ZIOFF_067325 [Zingiber officinale]